MRQQDYERQYREFCAINDGRFKPKDSWPILNDDRPQPAEYCFEYLAHVGWAARILAKTKTKKHVDFGSHVYFAGVASAITEDFTFYDIRPIDLPLPGLQCKSADLVSLDIPDNSEPSVSCMHVLEHVGLSRYSDTLDPKGDLKAASELCRITKPGGDLLIVEPVNEIPRLSFNAHRLYSFNQIISMFSEFDLIEFTLIKNRSIIYNADSSMIVKEDAEMNDTACLWMKKR